VVTQAYVSLSELAQHLGTTRRTLYGYIRRGELRAERMPLHYTDSRPRKTSRSRWRVHRDEAERFMQQWRSVVR
jgi:excisionase family DNA binding protein